MKTYRLEHDEQSALFTWAEWSAAVFPQLRLMFSIPNGGHRNLLVARKMKREGAKAGVPDILLPVAKHGYHGLFIEMKTENHRPKREGSKGGLSDLQIEWIERLRRNGYKVEVCYGSKEAQDVLTEYLT